MAFGTVVQRRTPVLFAGRLRNKIDIVIPLPAQDSTGGYSLLANTVWANVWSTIEPIIGNEQQAAGTEMSTVTHSVLIRFIGAAPSWFKLTNYLGAALVKDSNGNLQQAQASGGLSGTVAPTWATGLGDLTQDGDPSTGVVWKNLGPAPLRTAVSSKMQVQYQGRQFQILDVQNPDERNKMLFLMCIEIDTQANVTLTPGVSGTYANDSLQQTIDAEIATIDTVDGGTV